MRFSTLKDKFKNKFNIRIIAGVLVFTLVGTGVSAYEVSAARSSGEVTAAAEETENRDEESGTENDEGGASDETDEDLAGTEEDGDDAESVISRALGGDLSVSEKEIGKEETVYVIADTTGAAEKVIVSEHLINVEKKAQLTDRSDLTDIENVKGDETFSQTGNQLVWQADGNDIYYQGTVKKELPVTQKITYFLDGKEISPEELAGKSGTVRIRFDYTNHTQEKVRVNGAEESVSVPFVAISGLILDDHFSNIQVENGRTVTDGSRNVVIGYALPGLKESLQIGDEDFDGGLTIPDYVEVTADVTDFSMDMTMTVVMNATGLLEREGEGDLSSLDEMFDTLTDAVDQLTDGSAELADGMDTLQDKLGEFSDGVNSLKTGLDSYTQGASQLADGAGQLKTGVDTLAGNVPTLIDGVGQLKAGSANAVSGANALRDGAGSVRDGAGNLRDGAGSLRDGANALKDGSAQVAAGVGQIVNMVGVMQGKVLAGQEQINASVAALAASGLTIDFSQSYTDIFAQLLQMKNAGMIDDSVVGQVMYLKGTIDASANVAGVFNDPDTQAQLSKLSELQAGADAVAAGTASLADGAAQLADGAGQLADGATQVADGAASLADGLGTLDAGLGTLNEKAGALSAGVNQLSDGANQLASGSSQLASNNGALMDGVSKLSAGTSAIIDGVGALDDGAHELADGIVTFNEDGIQKILDSYNGDLEPLMDRLEAVLDAGEAYQNYAGAADGVNSSVRFIYRTAAVSSEQ